jgi:hypothetical protein
MVSQRIHGLALGYEDLCDQEQLLSDQLAGPLSGKRDLDEQLPGKEHIEPAGVGRPPQARSQDQLLGRIRLLPRASSPSSTVKRTGAGHALAG